MAEYLLGLDNGSTVIKAAIFDTKGREIAVSGEKIEMHMPESGWYERSLDEIWEANAKAIKSVLRESGLHGRDITAVAATGHGNGLHLVDRNGEAVWNAIEGFDTRACKYVEKWQADGTLDKVFPLITQNLFASQWPPLLAWFRDNKSEVLEKAESVFCVKDYVRFKLTGVRNIEMTDLSGCGIMNVPEGRYDDRILDAFGLSSYRRLLPEIVKSDEICGYVTPEAAALTGLELGTPVAGGAFDIDAVGLALGLNDESKLNLIAGTWGNNQCLVRNPVIDKDLFMVSRYAIDGYYLILEGSPTGASNLEWFVTELMKKNGFKASPDQSVYALCDIEVDKTSAEDADIICLPFLYGNNCGGNARAAYIGMEGHHTRNDMLRAVFEGIVFSHRTHIEKLMKHREAPTEIRMGGGAGKSKVWTQIFADILQIPIEIPEGTETGALGAAICAGSAAGIFSSLEDGISKMVSMGRRVKPDRQKAEIYNRKYDLYRKAVKVLKAYWE